ncbi:hypothetical protein BDF19DRAFT_435261 [Syncephalis fuscata]|nr:hypothetical protein BDF19DRAFT_435261 [Syncephalis fuscata]
MSVPQSDRIFAAIVSVDKELRQQSKAISDPLDKELAELRLKLRDNVEQLLLTDIKLAQRKGIENIMWRRVFYHVIEEYRRRVKKFPEQDAVRKTSEYRRARQQLRSFLYGASSYFNTLLRRLVERYDCHLAAKNILGDSIQLMAVTAPVAALTTASRSNAQHFVPESIRKRAYQTVYRCYIYLGDIARYSELHSDRKQKRWATSVDLYKKAQRSFPEDGNAHNQMAVLSTYINDEFSGVYHYYCSMSSSQPFPTAQENISLLLEHVRTCTIVKNAMLDAPPITDTTSTTAPLADNQVKDMFRVFLSLHAAVYFRDSVKPFEKIQSKLLNLFEICCQTRQLGQESLTRMLTINLCAHNHTRQPITGSGSTINSSDSKRSQSKHGLKNERQRETVELFILQFTLHMMTIMLRTTANRLIAAGTPSVTQVEAISQSSESINGLIYRIPLNVRRLLPGLRIAVSWLRTTFDQLPVSVVAQQQLQQSLLPPTSSIIDLDVYIRMVRLLREGKRMADMDQGIGYTEYPNARIVFYGERPRTGAPEFAPNSTWPAVFSSAASHQEIKDENQENKQIKNTDEELTRLYYFKHTIRRPRIDDKQPDQETTIGQHGSNVSWDHFNGPRLIDFQAIFKQEAPSPTKAIPHTTNNSHTSSGKRLSLPTSDTLFSWTPNDDQLWSAQHSTSTIEEHRAWMAGLRGTGAAEELTPTSMSNQQPPTSSNTTQHTSDHNQCTKSSVVFDS